MVSQTNKAVAREIDNLSETEARAVAEFIFRLVSKRFFKQTDNLPPDDLIAALADARENRRARQVVEWEKLRRQNLQQRAA